MSTTTVHHVSLLTPSATPLNSRGARLAAQLFAQLYRVVERAFTDAKPARATATSTATRAEEAQEVRAMAWQVERTDPGFASDLYAAAARHEGLNAA